MTAHAPGAPGNGGTKKGLEFFQASFFGGEGNALRVRTHNPRKTGGQPDREGLSPPRVRLELHRALEDEVRRTRQRDRMKRSGRIVGDRESDGHRIAPLHLDQDRRGRVVEKVMDER
ncbi:MAG: hypothetical protein RLZZ399_2115 [Verrucomicrobiota bacterium]